MGKSEFSRRPIVRLVLHLAVSGMLAAQINSATAQTSNDLKVSYTVGTGFNATQWLAAKNGIFQRNGLNVELVAINTSAADIISATLSGTVNVGCGNGPYPTIAAAENGAEIKAIYSQYKSVDYQLVINKSAAEAKNIPIQGSAKDQIGKLKSSGFKIVFSNPASDAFNSFVAGAKRIGLDIKNDVTITFVGSYANIFAAFASGQAEAFGASSPQVFQVHDDQVLRIRYPDAFPGEANTDFAYCFTTDAFAAAHAEALTSFSKGMLQARDYIIAQPDKAKQDLAPYWVEARISDPMVQSQATEALQRLLKEQVTPAIQKSSWEATLALVNDERQYAANPPLPPVTRTYENFVDNRYVRDAIKQLGMNLPVE